MLIDDAEIERFKQYLKEARVAINEDMQEHPDYPAEAKEFAQAIERLETQLDNPKSQQLIADLLLVFSFMGAMANEDEEWDEEDEDEEWDDEEVLEDEETEEK